VSDPQGAPGQGDASHSDDLEAHNPNIASALHIRAAQHPDRSAIIEYRRGRVRRVSFGELSVEVKRAAGVLQREGIGPGDRVLVLVPMSADLYGVFLGCLHLGATVVFVDAWAGRKRLEDAVSAAAPRAFIGVRKGLWLRFLSPSLRRIPLRLRVKPGRGLVKRMPAGPLPPTTRVAAENPALVTFTTGTTGQPKGAVRSHEFLWAQHHALTRHMAPRADDVDMPTLPIFVLNNLAGGVPSVLPDFDPRRPAEIDPADIHRQMVAEGVTTTTGSPAFYERLATWCREERKPLPLRALFTGGAPVLPPLARLLSEVVTGQAHVIYGSTEAEPISGISVEGMLEAWGRGVEPGGGESGPHPQGLCVGPPVPETSIRVLRVHEGPIRLDQGGWPLWEVPRGGAGELVVAGDHVLEGYVGDPEAETLAKIRDQGSGRVWHRTGDAARLDPEGWIWLLGRVGARVVREEREWWPLPAELRALALPRVRHAAFLGAPDPELGSRAVLCVEVPGGRLDDEGRRDLRAALDPIPVDEIRAVGRIPRDPRHESKTDMGALRALLDLG